MGLHATLFGVVMTALVVVASQGQQVSSPTPRSEFKCEVTKPNDVAAGEEKPARGSYGNREVSVGPFGLWPDGTIIFKPGGAGFITQSGALGMKFGWMRGVSGELKITGRRLDGEAPPLRSQVTAGY